MELVKGGAVDRQDVETDPESEIPGQVDEATRPAVAPGAEAEEAAAAEAADARAAAVRAALDGAAPPTWLGRCSRCDGYLNYVGLEEEHRLLYHRAISRGRDKEVKGRHRCGPVAFFYVYFISYSWEYDGALTKGGGLANTELVMTQRIDSLRAIHHIEKVAAQDIVRGRGLPGLPSVSIIQFQELRATSFAPTMSATPQASSRA